MGNRLTHQGISFDQQTLGTLPLLQEIYLNPVWWRRDFYEFKYLQPSVRHLGCFAPKDLRRIDIALARQLAPFQVRSYRIMISPALLLIVL